MLFLDANAFYSYIGRKNIGLIESTHVNEEALRNFLDTIKEKSLPTSVFIEIMVHYRDDPARLRKILNYRRDKGLPLFNNIPDYCVSDDEITCVYHLGDEDIKKYAYKLLDEKIGVESRFTYLFYEITKNLYLEYRLRELGKFSDSQKEDIWDFLGRQEFRTTGDKLTDEFCDILYDGYRQGKDQNLLKAKYIDVLNDACKMIDLTLAGCITCIENESDISSSLQAAYNETIDKGFDGMNGTMPGIVTLLQTNTVFLNEAKNTISKMFLKHGYNKYQVEYLKEVMFSAWFDRAQKLKKNDIFDMMCAGCLAYVRPIKEGESVLVNTQSYIMSFDSTMEKFISNVRPTNSTIIDRYKN